MTILSVHSIIAGLALGIQIEDVWPVFIALAAHKWVEAFAMGVNLLKNKVSSKLFLRCVLFYTSMVPAGIVIGALLSLALSHHVAVYLEAFVTGIFLSITVFNTSDFSNCIWYFHLYFIGGCAASGICGCIGQVLEICDNHLWIRTYHPCCAFIRR